MNIYIMKWLKLFEELDEKVFTKIREKVWNDWIEGGLKKTGKSFDKCSDYELNKIEKDIKEHYQSIDVSREDEYTIIIKERGNGYVSYPDSIEATKFEDGWWLVSGPSYKSGEVQDKYYKCDQIHGLLECLIEIISDWDL